MSVEYRPQFDMAMEWASAATALLAYTGLVTSLTYQIRSLLAGSRSTVVLAITAGTSVTILNTTVEVVNTYLNKSTAVQVFFMWTQFFTVLFSNLVGLEVLYVFAPLVPGLSARAVRYMQAGAAVFQVIAWGGGYVRFILFDNKTDPRWFARWYNIGVTVLVAIGVTFEVILLVFIAHQIAKCAELRALSGKLLHWTPARIRQHYHMILGFIYTMLTIAALAALGTYMSNKNDGSGNEKTQRLAYAYSQTVTHGLMVNFVIKSFLIEALTLMLFGRTHQGSQAGSSKDVQQRSVSGPKHNIPAKVGPSTPAHQKQNQHYQPQMAYNTQVEMASMTSYASLSPADQGRTDFGGGNPLMTPTNSILAASQQKHAT